MNSTDPRALSRKSGYWKCINGYFSAVHKYFLPQVGGQCFCTQRKSTDITPKTPKTDWPSFEFSIWLLLITLFKSCVFVLRVTTTGMVSADVWSTGMGLEPPQTCETSYKAWSSVVLLSPREYVTVFTPAWFALGSFWTETTLKQVMLRGSHRASGCGTATSLTETWQSAMM